MMICDYVCSGPSLLKAAKKKFPNAKLFAYNPNGIGRRLKRILEKELDVNVNIIMEMKDDMKFCKIIMNPPYDKNLHLKILQEAMKHSDDIVNLSPIRWLHDPFASDKKSTEFERFKNIRKHIADIEVISAKEANDLFGINLFSDLGIYTINDKGGFDTENFWKVFRSDNNINILGKIKNHDCLKNHIEKNQRSGIRVPLTNIAGNRGNLPIYKDISVLIDGLKDGKDWTKCKNMGGYEKPENSLLPNSVKFDIVEEAQNFYNSFKTKFFRYICNITVQQQNIQTQVIPFMPTYKQEWTDEQLYKYFDLTQEEIDEIESSIDKL